MGCGVHGTWCALITINIHATEKLFDGVCAISSCKGKESSTNKDLRSSPLCCARTIPGHHLLVTPEEGLKVQQEQEQKAADGAAFLEAMWDAPVFRALTEHHAHL